MIEVRNLVKRYPGVTAVAGISFDIQPGEIVGFLGPNGSGKTTTMRILTTYLAPTAGSAKVAGFDVVRESLDVRRRVGYLPENNPLYTEMRVREFLMYRGALRGLAARDRSLRSGEVMDLCGVTPMARRIIGQLSKGYRQRVGLADAILHRPTIVILDEPTIGLDPTQIQEVRELIRRLGAERTVILSTHILSEVEMMCGRIMIMSGGRLVSAGAIDQIARTLRLVGKYRLVVGGDGRAVKAALDSMDGVARVLWMEKAGAGEFDIESKDDRDLREGLYRLARDQKWDLRELVKVKATLDTIFSYITSGKGGAA